MATTKKGTTEKIQAAEKLITNRTALADLAAARKMVGELREPAAPEPPVEPPAPPEPEPTPSPIWTPPHADLFNLVKKSDASYDEEGHAGAITEVSDPLGQMGTVLKYTVLDTDVAPKTATENPRAKLGGPEILKIGGPEFWIRSRFMFSSGFPLMPAGGWLTLVDIYGKPSEESAPVKVGLQRNSKGENALVWEQNGAHGFAAAFSEPLTYDHWYDLIWRERLATTGGLVQMWLDGEEVVDQPSYATVTAKANGKASNYAAISQYRKHGMWPTATLYYAGLWVGTTRASVGG